MSSTIRFPHNRIIPNVGPNEDTQIITLHAAVTAFPRGGVSAYTSIRPWWISGDNDAAPYECIVIEFSSTLAGTLGDGEDDLIGLYGEVDLVETPANPAQRIRTLLGLIGINIGNAAPQIPFVVGPAADVVGYSQMFNNIAGYDRLSIGGVLADVNAPGDAAITVRARPIRRRDYLG